MGRATVVLLLSLLCGTARADLTALEQLAPTQDEVDAALEAVEQGVIRARALEEATLLLQNALGEVRATHRRLPVCEDDDVTSLVARARVFGAAWRDAAQRLRVEAARLDRMSGRGTAAVDAPRLNAVKEAAATGAAAAALAGAWHGTFIETAFEECTPELRPGPGLPRAARAAGEAEGLVAVVVTGGGFLCPDLVPADGRVAVVPAKGCISRRACACEPRALRPAEVLGSASGQSGD